MKKSPLSVALITALITIIVCLVVGYFIMENATPHSIGDTVTEKVEFPTSINVREPVEATDTTTRTATFVYLGASSKLYESEAATTSWGIFLDTFEGIELAELIDTAGFPYKQEYVAVTSSTDPVRYMFKTVSGKTFWVEP